MNISPQKMFQLYKKWLTEYPKWGRKVPEANREEIREAFENEYKIIYRVELRIIFIFIIRNFKQLLQENDKEQLRLRHTAQHEQPGRLYFSATFQSR